ncbi:MAG: hypothetical protein IJJ33_12275 [Victivallales bacterium]|nr:hypothetical protein [Victivallales bacterium]
MLFALFPMRVGNSGFTLRATRFPFLPPLARFHYPVTFHPWVPLAASAFALRATAGQARLRFTHG